VAAGRVAVNGRVVGLGDRADPDADVLTLDGRPVRPDRKAYWILHKPSGVLTTARDTHGRRTVLDLVPRDRGRLFPVGRLDRDTEGLLLLTNDGEVAQALLHPSRESPRVYRVTVRGRLDGTTARRLARGVRLDDDTVTAPARVGRREHDAESDTTTFPLTLVEGRKRQIRRALDALGHPVVRLVRTRMGPLELGRLPRGRARELSSAERRRLLDHARRHGARGEGEGP